MPDPTPKVNVKVICPKGGESTHNSWCYRERLPCSTENINDEQYFRIFQAAEAAKIFVRHFRDCEIQWS